MEKRQWYSLARRLSRCKSLSSVWLRCSKKTSVASHLALRPWRRTISAIIQESKAGVALGAFFFDSAGKVNPSGCHGELVGSVLGGLHFEESTEHEGVAS